MMPTLWGSDKEAYRFARCLSSSVNIDSTMLEALPFCQEGPIYKFKGRLGPSQVSLTNVDVDVTLFIDGLR